MKKLAILLFSVSMLVVFSANAGVKSQKVSNDVAYSDTQADRPIYPPVG
ncbi:hypothetical protein ACIQXV_18835 [Neobacillus sp. NPDC097160]